MVAGVAVVAVSDLEEEFLTRWRQIVPHFPEPQREFAFAVPRRWRFDFAWEEAQVAVEIEGGTWLGRRGRHTSGVGYQADMEKYNAAQILGWRVLRFSAGMLRRDPIGCIHAVVSLLDPLPEAPPSLLDPLDGKRGRGPLPPPGLS